MKSGAAECLGRLVRGMGVVGRLPMPLNMPAQLRQELMCAGYVHRGGGLPVARAAQATETEWNGH